MPGCLTIARKLPSNNCTLKVLNLAENKLDGLCLAVIADSALVNLSHPKVAISYTWIEIQSFLRDTRPEPEPLLLWPRSQERGKLTPFPSLFP